MDGRKIIGPKRSVCLGTLTNLPLYFLMCACCVPWALPGHWKATHDASIVAIMDPTEWNGLCIAESRAVRTMSVSKAPFQTRLPAVTACMLRCLPSRIGHDAPPFSLCLARSISASRFSPSPPLSFFLTPPESNDHLVCRVPPPIFPTPFSALPFSDEVPNKLSG